MLDEPHLALTRTFTAVVELLHLKLTLADPAQHLPLLEAHLRSLLQSQPTATLPADLAAALKPLIAKLTSIRNTAASLSSLVANTPALAGLRTPPTACAILILALEGERAASLPSTGSLAQVLGARVGASKAVVMQRYKAVYDVIEECIREVPWLETHERKGKGRSKVAKRVVVARGLKDVVQFQDEIWKKKFEGVKRPVLNVEPDDNDSGDDTDERTGVVGESSVPAQPGATRGETLSTRAPRRSAHTRDVQRASQFLLNPLAQGPRQRTAGSMSGPGQSAARQDLLEHLLTVDTPALSDAFVRAPTRLQMLAASRGGGEEEKVRDEELFEEGEMEALLRDPGEVEALRLVLDWDGDEEEETDQREVGPGASAGGRKRRRDASDEGGRQGAKVQKSAATTTAGMKRIDMDALARLLDPDTHLEEQTEKYPEEAEVIMDGDGVDAPYTFTPDPDEIVEEWRPLSPGPGCSFDDDRYDT